MSPARLLAVATALALFCLFASRAAAEEKPHSIAEQVKASLKDPARPFTMVLRLKVKDDAADKFEAAFATARKATRKEPGNLAYDLNRDAKTPTEHLVYERRKNRQAL